MTNITTLILQFANELSPNEIVHFRGAVINSLNENNILFHNHTESGNRYSYPLIQYKRIHQKAAIVCIGDGAKAICDLFTSGHFVYQIGNKSVEMQIESIFTREYSVETTSQPISYRLKNWLPLNSDNYREYMAMDNMASRLRKLEDILTANILSMLKGESIGIHLDQQLTVEITDIKKQQLIHYKGIKMMAFDVEFRANIVIPDYIGLGKSSSVGFGVITKKTNKQL